MWEVKSELTNANLKLFIKLIRVVNLTGNLQVYLQLMYAALRSAATSNILQFCSEQLPTMLHQLWLQFSSLINFSNSFKYICNIQLQHFYPPSVVAASESFTTILQLTIQKTTNNKFKRQMWWLWWIKTNLGSLLFALKKFK